MTSTVRRALRIAASLAMVAAVVFAFRVLLRVNSTTAALTLLLVVLGISAWWGLLEATVASLAAMVGFNLFFLPPIGTLTIDDPQNYVALIAFLVTAVTASQLSARVRRRAAEAEARRREIEQLYSLVQSMVLSGSVRRTIREFVNRTVQVFGCAAVAVYYRPNEEFFRSGPESEPVADHDLQVATEVSDLTMDVAQGVATSPLRLGGRPLGSLALVAPLPSKQTVRAIVHLLALAIEKARALEEASQAEASRQSEALKSALLDSLAHDIKTPLTSIKAAVTSLLSAPASQDHELLTIINEEADRLNQLAAEVIAMARVEAGKLHLDRRPVPAAELIDGALGRLPASLRTRPLEVRAQAGLPDVDADPEFAQEVVKQLVENALKYSPEGSPVTISAERKGAKIVIGVADRGPGIDEMERARLFEKFFRGRRHRFDTKGTGMGLAIAKGIIEAHGERIWVESEPEQGAAFYFTLPASDGAQR